MNYPPGQVVRTGSDLLPAGKREKCLKLKEYVVCVHGFRVAFFRFYCPLEWPDGRADS